VTTGEVVSQRWIVARTKPNREQWAAENLARQGFIYYSPTITEVIKKGALRLAIAKPLFPNHIFVQASERWRPLLSTFGISSVIMSGQYPATLPLYEIERIRKLEDTTGAVVLPKRTGSAFRPGQLVRVKGGQFSGYHGLCEGMSAKEREAVLIDFLGRKARVLIAADLLEVA
jgi:transcriptional antiterminator RfaH